jgi:hypothetical protein
MIGRRRINVQVGEGYQRVGQMSLKRTLPVTGNLTFTRLRPLSTNEIKKVEGRQAPYAGERNLDDDCPDAVE